MISFNGNFKLFVIHSLIINQSVIFTEVCDISSN